MNKVVIATKHNKEKVIGPIIKDQLGLEFYVPENFDTDKYGSFTREVKRRGTQLETARRKAKDAAMLTGSKLVITSEGSFVPSPYIPFININIELIYLLDIENNFEVEGWYETHETNINGSEINSAEEAVTLAKEWGFPQHGVILRKRKNLNYFINKNINNQDELEKSVENLINWPLFKSAYLETDMRADRNPTRMHAIEKATKEMVKNYKTECPKCKKPGFSAKKSVEGLECEICDTPTKEIKYHIYKCNSCKYEKKSRVEKENADASNCLSCNA